MYAYITCIQRYISSVAAQVLLITDISAATATPTELVSYFHIIK